MNLQLVSRYFSRAIFGMATVGLVIAIVQLIGRFFGFDPFGQWYSAGRLIELSAALLAFVIVVLLRQIRDELRSNQGS